MNSDRVVIVLAIAARISLGAMFMISALRLTRLTTKAVAGLAGRGVPVPRAMLYLAIAYKVTAAGLLIAGVLVVPTAISLILYTLLATWLMLDFWNKSGAERVGAESGAQANLGVLAALLLLIAWTRR